MTSILKTLAVAVTLLGGIVTLAGSALAGSDNTYGWAYPDNFKNPPKVPVQHLGGGSGIPPLYR
jgi:hypothetical protein